MIVSESKTKRLSDQTKLYKSKNQNIKNAAAYLRGGIISKWYYEKSRLE